MKFWLPGQQDVVQLGMIACPVENTEVNTQSSPYSKDPDADVVFSHKFNPCQLFKTSRCAIVASKELCVIPELTRLERNDV